MDRKADEELQARIRQKAHDIWEREGRPEGREREHWEMAAELIAQSEVYPQTLRSNPSHGPDDVATHQQAVEPTLAVENMGDVPGLRDQGEERQFPTREARKDAREGS